MLKLVLASQSPRRRELLEKAGFDFTVSLVKVSEIFDENMNPSEVASHLATKKGLACFEQHKSLNQPGNLILSADTIVVLGDQILGKPESPPQALDFLRRLSGRTHYVMSGLALLRSGSEERFVTTVVSEVRFRRLTDEEISAYVATGEPMDKAGAYAIQGGAEKFVVSLVGSWTNVVGLPMEVLANVLQEKGWSVGRRTPKAT